MHIQSLLNNLLFVVLSLSLIHFLLTFMAFAWSRSTPAPQVFAFEELAPLPRVAEESISVSLDYSTLTVAELRKLCSDRGITWRNAHSKGKHLKKAEMVELLSSLA
jgi:hypothetical protein